MLPPAARPPASRRSRSARARSARSALLRLALGLAAAGAAAYLVWSGGSQARAIRRLPEPDRRALYARTLEELGSVCADPPAALRDHCRRQAEFLSEFPECDSTCEGRVRRLFPQPLR